MIMSRITDLCHQDPGFPCPTSTDWSLEAVRKRSPDQYKEAIIHE